MLRAMARVAIGVGMSHSPMVVCGGESWLRFAELDRHSTLLVDTSGRPVSFQELEAANGLRYEAQAAPENLLRQAAQVTRSLARLKRDFAEADVDAVVVIGDDQMELFDYDNMPALGIFYGDELVSCTQGRFGRFGARVGGLDDVHRGYGMDEHRRWPGHPELALHLISTLLGGGFDVGAMKSVSEPDRAGVGHAFGVVEMQLMDDEKLPLVPVYVNNYWPPNQLPPRRCWQLGAALRGAIESYPEDLRVAIVASGGLSHFVTDESLDEQVLAALRTGDGEVLCDLPAHLLNSGNSEIRNWIALAAACLDMELAWDDYIPVYRTPAGTGCGLTFARWS
jgi:hypothetical protein